MEKTTLHPLAWHGMVLQITSGIALVAITCLTLGSPGLLAQDSEDARLEVTTESDAARRHFWVGINDALNVFPAGATRHFQMAIDADPNFGFAMVLKASVNPLLNGAQRREAMREGLNSMDGASSVEVLFARALLERGSTNAPAASRIFATLSEILPGDPHVAMYAEQIAGARGVQAGPLGHWQDLIDRFPDFAPAYNSLGYAQWNSGNHGAGMTTLAKYMELAPDHPNAHDSYAEVNQYDGRFPEAIAHYQRAAELDPSFNQAYVGAAEVYHLVGQLGLAVEQMNLAVEHAISPPNKVTTLRQLASIQAQHGDREGAMGTLGRAAQDATAAELNNAVAAVHQQMALTDVLLHQGRTAQRHLDQAAEADGAETLGQLATTGLVHASSGNAQSARDVAAKFRETFTNPGAQWLPNAIVAMALLSEDKPQEALNELDGANPSIPLVQVLMSQAYAALNRPAAAAAKRQDAVGNRVILLANMYEMFALGLVQQD